MRKGIFITFEGGDGCGKTTIINMLKEKLKSIGRDVLIPREPGATLIGEQIRDILLDRENKNMTERTELLLYEASRAQNCFEVIMPALKEGKVVLCDRFYDSSIAYQGYGRGMDIESIKKINKFASFNVVPDKTILLVRDSVDAGLNDASKKGGSDRLELEGHDFHTRVLHGFLEISKEDPNRWETVKFDKDKNVTFNRVWDKIKELF